MGYGLEIVLAPAAILKNDEGEKLRIKGSFVCQ